MLSINSEYSYIDIMMMYLYRYIFLMKDLKKEIDYDSFKDFIIDNYYKIDISGEKFVVPYEVEFEGEIYKVTEVDLITVGQVPDGNLCIANAARLRTRNTAENVFVLGLR